MPCTVSIVTSTKDCASALRATAQSIRTQSHKSIQWIIADGLSTDDTVEVIKENEDVVSSWRSEADSGIYDAWNRACQALEGDWVLFMGAGDVFVSSTSLESAVRELQCLNASVVLGYGNVIKVVDGRRERGKGEVDLGKWDIHQPALPDHQGVFHRINLFRNGEPFDKTYRIAADSKFLIKAIRFGEIAYFDVDVCVMDPEGVSAHPRYALLVLRECLRMERELGYKLPWKSKAIYLFTAWIRFLVYKLAGARVVGAIAKIKRHATFQKVAL